MTLFVAIPLRGRGRRSLLSAFSRAFTLALASPSFVEETKPAQLKRWKDDLGRFMSLRAAVALRYGERVDWKEYEQRIRQLLDRHIVSREVVNLVPPLNIFDDIAIDTRREGKTETDASIADTIAHRLTKSIEEKWDEDPIFFERFSKLVRSTIDDFHKGRIDELTYLATMRENRDKIQNRQDAGDPSPLRVHADGHALAFWGIVQRDLEKSGAGDAKLAADIALKASEIVRDRRKVGWQNDRDVENAIRNDIDDFYFGELRAKRGALIDPATLDAIVDDILTVARARLAQ